jgi:predicted DNA repair protein MutK
MAVFLPLLVIGGAPVCYATYKVFETVDKETTRFLASNEKEQGTDCAAMNLTKE